MGNTCCQGNIQEGLLFQVTDAPKESDYVKADWPSDDQFLASKLTRSHIGQQKHEQKPRKHKLYDRWYCGDWKHGQPTGKGILYIKGDFKNTYYEGDFKGQPHGRGKVIFNGGEAVYEGDIKNAKAEGEGYFRNYKEGTTFTGIWKDSNPYKGELLLQKVEEVDGHKEILISTVYIDESKEENVIKYHDGRVYTGIIDKERFVPHGNGKVEYPNGSIYQGTWKDGQMYEGSGKFTWPDNSSYEGEYLYGKKHGQGKFTFSSGKYYQGEWTEGKQNGKGILYSQNSEELKNGTWQDGKFVKEE